MKKSVLKKLLINFNGIYCPECSLLSTRPTAHLHHLYDEQYKKDKYYIKCKYCKTVTPAFENEKDAMNNWDWLFIKKEHQLFGE